MYRIENIKEHEDKYEKNSELCWTFWLPTGAQLEWFLFRNIPKQSL